MQETNYSKIAKKLNSNGGFITRKQVDEACISSWFLTDFVRRNELKKIDKGFFATADWIRDDFYVFQYKYPRFIFSFQSALFLHGLTDILPMKLEVTGPKNYRPFSSASSVVVHTDSHDEIYSLGVEKIKTNLGNAVKVYNLEKTICDIVKHSSRMDSEIFSKALFAYVKEKKHDIQKLMAYSRQMNIEKKMQEIMMVVWNDN